MSLFRVSIYRGADPSIAYNGIADRTVKVEAPHAAAARAIVQRDLAHGESIPARESACMLDSLAPYSEGNAILPPGHARAVAEGGRS